MEKVRSTFTWLVAASFASFAGFALAEDAAGRWQGEIGTPPPLAIVVDLEHVDGAWQGTIDIPAQGAMGLPLADVDVDGDAVRFAIAGLPGEPTFDGTLDADTIEGTFTQAGQAFDFELRRVDADAADPAPAPEAAVPGAPGPASMDPAAPATAPEDVYEDPAGVFTVPVPMGWQVTEREDHLLLTSPDGGIRLYLLTLEEDDLEAALSEAWAAVDPEFDAPVDETFEPPSDPGIERTLMVVYDTEQGTFQQGIAQLHEGVAHVLLVDAELEALQRRGTQVNIVFTGYQILALEDVDLTDAEPRRVDEVLGELAEFIDETMTAFGIPGAAVAIVQDDEVVYAHGFGVREALGDEPMTPDTHMMIGSTGKTLTTMLMAVLVDEGAFDWDTPVVEVLPEFAVADPALTESMTMWNLVCACSGVPRRDLELLFNADDLTAEDVIASLRDFEFFTDFGEVFQYSNQLVGTGGYAAAAATGVPFGELLSGYDAALRERVLEPLGMHHTTLWPDDVIARGEHATPHRIDFDTGAYVPLPLEVEELLLPIAPAGAHWSTASDMARYLVAQLQVGVAPDGTRVVSEENLRATWEPQVPITATESYGLGWIVGEYRGLQVLHHGGNTLGFTSEFAFLPGADLGIVVLANTQGANAFTGAVRTRLFELVYDQPSQAEQNVAFALTQLEDALADMREETGDRVDPDAVEPYLGTFADPALGEIVITLVDERLVLDAGEFRTELRPVLDDAGEVEAYMAFEGPVAGAEFDFTEEDGERVVVLGEGAIRYVFTRVE